MGAQLGCWRGHPLHDSAFPGGGGSLQRSSGRELGELLGLWCSTRHAVQRRALLGQPCFVQFCALDRCRATRVHAERHQVCLGVKQVDDMSISEKDRLQYLVGSMDQKLDVRLPDVVELTQDLSQKYLAFNQVGTIICLYPNPEVSAETETQAKGSQPPVLAVQMKADQVDRILCHPAMMRNHHMSAYLETMNEALAAEPAARRCVVM